MLLISKVLFQAVFHHDLAWQRFGALISQTTVLFFFLVSWKAGAICQVCCTFCTFTCFSPLYFDSHCSVHYHNPAIIVETSMCKNLHASIYIWQLPSMMSPEMMKIFEFRYIARIISSQVKFAQISHLAQFLIYKLISFHTQIIPACKHT